MRRKQRNRRGVSLGDAKPQADAIPTFLDPDFDDMERAEEDVREEFRGYGSEED